MLKRFRFLSALALLTLLASCAQTPTPEFAPGPPLESAAVPTDLFVSEYVEGSSFNKAIEIYNGTGASVDLASYRLELYSNGSTSLNTGLDLTGTLDDGKVFVIAHPNADASIAADAESTVANFNGDDVLLFKKEGVVVDAFGQLGVDPGDAWSGAGVSAKDSTLRRKAAVCTGDANAADAFDPSLEWGGFAEDAFDGLGSHTIDCGGTGETAPSVSSTVPAADATGVALDGNIVITFGEPVNVTGSWFMISCATSGAHTAAFSGGPTKFTLNPDTDFAEGETCTVTVSTTQVTDQDSDDPPDAMAEDYSFSFSTQLGLVKIHAVQASGSESPLEGQTVTIEGVVVGDFQGSDELNGFFVQEEDAEVDIDPSTSEGLFIFEGGSSAEVSVGDLVQVTGVVDEFHDLTELTSIASITVVSSEKPLPAVTDLTLPLESFGALEPYEGMYVRFPQALVISEYFNYDRFGEIVLSLPLDGLARPFQPTSYVEPGAAANALQEALELRRITLDDGRSAQNPFPARHPNGEPFGPDNLFRGGDTLTNTVGVLHYSFGLYRIEPTAGAEYHKNNPRPAAPEEVGGSLKVASFNVQNYFLSEGEVCGPSGDDDCRGADEPGELERQRAKIVEALLALDADVYGLVELENTPGVAPLADLTEALNEQAGAGAYAFIDTGTVGGDAIKVGILYKTSAVIPVSSYATLSEPESVFVGPGTSRVPLAQSFTDRATGGVFTVVVNHFKSKGSCDDASGANTDQGDGQGCFNARRVETAQALTAWLQTDPTGVGDSDYLLVGDFNAYDEEDPIDALKAAGYTDLIEAFEGEFAYSYVFDGLFGYLDYAFASASLIAEEQVTGTTEWHINADEPDIWSYDLSFNDPSYYQPNPYRTSDHDPVLVGLELTYTPAETLDLLQFFVDQYHADGTLNRGQANALSKKLEHIEGKLERGQTKPALNQLHAFENQVQAFARSGKLSQEQRGQLLTLAQALRNSL